MDDISLGSKNSRELKIRTCGLVYHFGGLSF